MPASRRLLAIATLISALGLGLSGCGLQQDLASRSDVAGSVVVASPISGPTTDGGELSADAMAGHVTVIDFWASWCAPCRAEQPDLSRLYQTYRARGVVFIGVDMRDDDASANAYRKDFAVAYPSVADPASSIAGAYDIAAPPTLVIVDRAGHVAARFLGTLVGAAPALDHALS